VYYPRAYSGSNITHVDNSMGGICGFLGADIISAVRLVRCLVFYPSVGASASLTSSVHSQNVKNSFIFGPREGNLLPPSTIV